MSGTMKMATNKSQNGVMTVTVEGTVDSEGALSLMEACRAAQDGGCSHVIVDLGSIHFINSSGIGALLVIDKEFEDAGGSARFVNLSKDVLNVIRLLDLEDELKLEVSVQVALAKIGVLAP